MVQAKGYALVLRAPDKSDPCLLTIPNKIIVRKTNSLFLFIFYFFSFDDLPYVLQICFITLCCSDIMMEFIVDLWTLLDLINVRV